MRANPKTKTLRNIRKWGKYYIGQGQRIAQETDVDSLRKFSDELWGFLYVLKSERLPDKRLSADTRDELKGLYDELRELMQRLTDRVTGLRRNEEITKRLERVALPEPAEGIETRDLSTWNMWPFRYSKRLRSKLAQARLPR